MEEQASQHKGGRDPFHLAPHPNLGGLPDTRVSILPELHAKPVDNHLAEALYGRELQRVRRVSLFVSLPTHRSCGVSAVWSWRSPAGRYTAPKIAESSWISPALGSLTYSLPTSLQHTTSSPIVIDMVAIHHRQGNVLDPSNRWSGSLPLTSTNCLGLAPPLSLCIARPQIAAHIRPKSASRQRGEFLQDLSYSTTVVLYLSLLSGI